jgi:zinc protease
MIDVAESALVPVSLPQRHERRLDNGLTVVACERSRVPLVSICLAFRSGSARDPEGKVGLADFTIELLRRGSERLRAAQIDEALERMGVDLCLETSPDTTYVMATTPSEHLAPMLRLLAELIQRPAFDAIEIKQARKRAIARLATDLDEPAVLAADAIGRVAFGSHPYGRPGRGLASDVMSFTRADCVRFARHHHRPQDAWLVLTGDVPPQEALELCERELGGWRGAGPAIEPLPEPPEIRKSSILLVDKPGSSQAQVRIASRAPGILDPRSMALRLSSQILGGGFTSRLNEAIRVNRGLSYGVASFVTDNEVGSLFAVSTYTKTESVRELFEVTLEETRRYREDGPSTEELERAQRYTNGLFPLMIETDDHLGRALADIKRFGRPDDWLETFRNRVLAVDKGQARDVAREFFLPSGYAAAVVGEARPLLKQLKPLGRVKVVPAEAFA